MLHKIVCCGLGANDLHVEITVLDQIGDVSTDYCNVLVKKHSVSVWITKSKTNIIVNALERKQEDNELDSQHAQGQMLPFNNHNFGPQHLRHFNNTHQQMQFLSGFTLSQNSEQIDNNNLTVDYKSFMKKMNCQ